MKLFSRRKIYSRPALAGYGCIGGSIRLKPNCRLLFAIIIIGTMAVLGGAFLIIANHQVSRKYSDRIYTIENVPAEPVALILGSQVWDNQQLSSILEDRILTGLALYQNGKVKKLLLSGDHGRKDYDEVNAMKKYLLERGVNANDIFLDHAGFCTYDSCYRARDVFGAKSLIIVTNGFHLPRALYIANELGIDAIGVASDRRHYLAARYNNLREILACGKAFYQTNIAHSKPAFLGASIDLTGSGLVTQD